MSAPTSSGLMAASAGARTVPIMRRYPASFLVMSATLTFGSVISGVIQQNAWLYVGAAIFAVAGVVYAVLRNRAATPPTE